MCSDIQNDMSEIQTLRNYHTLKFRHLAVECQIFSVQYFQNFSEHFSDSYHLKMNKSTFRNILL